MLTQRFVLLAALGFLTSMNCGCYCVRCTCQNGTVDYTMAMIGFFHPACDLNVCGYPYSVTEEIALDSLCENSAQASSVISPVPDPQFAAR